MAHLAFLGKTVEALFLLRQAECPLHRDARTLLVLIDGRRHERELKRLAASNGVHAFEETLAYLRHAGLVQELGDPGEGALTIDAVESDYPDKNLITMDFTRPAALQDNKPAPQNAPAVHPGAAPPPVPPAAQAGAGKDAAAPDLAARQKRQALREQAIRAKLIAHLRPRVEEELRAQLLPELRTSIVRELTIKLEAALRPRIEKRLRARLEAELRPLLRHELRAALEAEAAGLSCAPAPCSSGPDIAASPGASLSAPADLDANPGPPAPLIEPLT